MTCIFIVNSLIIRWIFFNMSMGFSVVFFGLEIKILVAFKCVTN